MTRRTHQLVIAVLVAGAPFAAAAQVNAVQSAVATVPTNSRIWLNWAPTLSWPGWAATLDCLRCVVHISAGRTWVEFGAEPVLRGTSAGGALVEGDVLVAVDRLLITTLAGARRLAELNNQPVTLTIRRKGQLIDVVVPQPIKWKFGTNDSIRVGLSAGGSDSTTQPTEMNVATTRGWLGIALDCLRCTVDREDHSSRDGTIRFTTPPKVVAVEPGAASLAGFATGDVIRTIDGHPMTSPEGARRFSSMRAGERVNFVVERLGALVLIRLLVPKPP